MKCLPLPNGVSIEAARNDMTNPVPQQVYLEGFLPQALVDGDLRNVIVRRNTSVFIKKATEQVFYYIIGYYAYEWDTRSLLLACRCFVGHNTSCKMCVRSRELKNGSPFLIEELKTTLVNPDISECIENASVGKRAERAQYTTAPHGMHLKAKSMWHQRGTPT